MGRPPKRSSPRLCPGNPLELAQVVWDFPRSGPGRRLPQPLHHAINLEPAFRLGSDRRLAAIIFSYAVLAGRLRRCLPQPTLLRAVVALWPLTCMAGRNWRPIGLLLRSC